MQTRIVLSLLLIVFLLQGCSEKKSQELKDSRVQTEIAKTTIAKITKVANKVEPKDPLNDSLNIETINGLKIGIKKTKTGLEFTNIENKVILFNFFTTWCSPCIAQLPHLSNLQNKYKNKLEIISVLLEEKDLEEIKRFIEFNKINFEVVYGPNAFNLAQMLGATDNIPYMVLYEPSGKYLYHYIGVVLEEMLDIDIAKVSL